MAVPLNSAFANLEDAGQDKASILVVDDLPEKLLVLRTVLEELDQNLVFVHSGSDALRAVLQQEFAVILLDVNMPDIDGLETASLIRRHKRSAHTPIIFITAYADEIQTAHGYSLGAVDYILSPVVPEVLRSKVKVFVELYLMNRRLSSQVDERIALAAAENARHAAEENTRRSNFLSQASRTLGASLDPDIAPHELLRLMVSEIARFAGLYTIDEPGDEGRMIVHDATLDSGSPIVTTRVMAQLASSMRRALRQAMERRARVEVHEAAVEEWGASADAPPGEPRLVSAVVVPVMLGERCTGALLVADVEERIDWSALEELASRAAIAFENARLYRSLQAEIVERRQAEGKLREANRRKDEFLAMLSHELRNPLAPIRSAVEVIRRLAPPDPKLTWATDVADRQVTQMTRLIDELLDVARISQGKIALQQELLDLRDVLAHGVETVRPFVDARMHTLSQHLPSVPVHVRGDYARLSQVVANLLHNAAKYTEKGGHIELTLGVESGEAVITVADDGIGIEAELLPNVFDLFEQGARSLDRSQGGMGVGLTLVHRLVTLHDGSIEAASGGHSQGAVFKVRLPCALPMQMPPEPLGVDHAAHAGMRVLVVDDNRDAAEMVATVLEMEGHETRAVNDGAQALDCVEQYRPHVVVLDIGLPGIDGYEVARRLRRLPAAREALLIALTGYGQNTDQARARQAGFDHHLVKPADMAVVLSLIDEWAGRSEDVITALDEPVRLAG